MIIMTIMNWTNVSTNDKLTNVRSSVWDETGMGTAKQQGETWGARSQDWATANEPAWKLVFETVLEGAGVRTGTHLLDIGCGAGGTLALARKHGADVSGLDAAEALVAIARGRLPGATIEIGEMEELPFANESFDVVTGVNSFQFAGDLVNALSEARRVCRKNGTVAMLVWGKREECDLLTKVMPAVFALLPPPLPDAPRPLPLADAGVIEGVMVQAGLNPKDAIEFSSPLAFADAALAVRAMMSASARAIAHVGENRVKSTIEEALRTATRGDGSVCLNNRFRLVLATRH
jgi:SAM-dependent methyltransferase